MAAVYSKGTEETTGSVPALPRPTNEEHLRYIPLTTLKISS
jgi:hypothetical protein